MLVGEGLESYAAGRTAAAIERFVEQMPRRARRLRSGVEEEVDAASLLPGDLILVRAGEHLPADGVIAEGASAINESSITGEPLPREKAAGDEVFSGSLNGPGLLRIEVTRAGEETTLARVVHLVREAEEKRAPVERLADRWARYFLPALLVAAALTLYFTRDWMRTVSVLIVGLPLRPHPRHPYRYGRRHRRIGSARHPGARRIRTATRRPRRYRRLRKTGTITEGQFEILRLLPLGRTNNCRARRRRGNSSDHPLARVIVRKPEAEELAIPPAEGGIAIPGRGVEAPSAGARSAPAAPSSPPKKATPIPAPALSFVDTVRPPWELPPSWGQRRRPDGREPSAARPSSALGVQPMHRRPAVRSASPA